MEFDQKRAFLEAQRAQRTSPRLSGDPFGAIVVAPPVIRFLVESEEQTIWSERSTRCVICWRECICKHKTGVESSRRVAEMQRQAASLYFQQQRATPPMQFQQACQSLAAPDAMVVQAGGSFKAGNVLGHRRTSFPAVDGRLSLQISIPLARLKIQPAIHSAPPGITPGPQTLIQLGLVVSRTYDQPFGGQQARFQALI